MIDLLLAERARSECARAMATVRPTRVPFQEREASELGRGEGWSGLSLVLADRAQKTN
jgi:hypothetical protein